MAEYLIELYVSRTNALGVEQHARRARIAAEELTRAGTVVRYLRSIFVPEDELCFLMFEAACEQDVRLAAHRADLRFQRISEALTTAEA